MTQDKQTEIATPKVRVLTPSELELSEALQKALVGKVTAEETLRVCRQEIGRLTGEINKLPYGRALVVWGEARDKIGAPPALTRAQLTKGT